MNHQISKLYGFFVHVIELPYRVSTATLDEHIVREIEPRPMFEDVATDALLRSVHRTTVKRLVVRNNSYWPLRGLSTGHEWHDTVAVGAVPNIEARVSIVDSNKTAETASISS